MLDFKQSNLVIENAIHKLTETMISYKESEMLILAICNIIIKYKINNNDNDNYDDGFGSLCPPLPRQGFILFILWLCLRIS
jgi:hypothetical protein